MIHIAAPKPLPLLTFLAAATLAARPAAAQTFFMIASPPKVDTSWVPAARTTPVQMHFTAMDGRQVDLAKTRGKITAVEFWALSDCAGCTEETAALKAAYDKYHAQGFEVVRIVTDSKAENKDVVTKMVKDDGITWPILFDGKGAQTEYVQKYKINRFPTILLFDKKGLLITNDATGNDIESYVAAAVR